MSQNCLATSPQVSSFISGAAPEFLHFGRFEQQCGQIPSERFGHTTTYIGNHKVLLFGGATGDANRYNITSDTYMLDLTQFSWVKLHAESTPHARAAHAAACVDTLQLVVFGGATGGGSLSGDELYLLDLRKDPFLQWMIVPINGVTPGKRYGHTMSFNNPNLIIFGGNDGQSTINDVWYMDVEKSPFCWVEIKLSMPRKSPLPRVYHSAEICREGPAAGMMVIFGGRDMENRSLPDAWGLRQHRDGSWDWVDAPNKKTKEVPNARYQHCAIFIGSKMIIIGGRADDDCTKILPTAVYDTEVVEWRNLPFFPRFRHSTWGIKNMLFSFGGFTHLKLQHPTNDLISADCSLYAEFYNDREKEEIRKMQISHSQSQVSFPSSCFSASSASSPSSASSYSSHSYIPSFYSSYANQQKLTSSCPQPLYKFVQTSHFPHKLSAHVSESLSLPRSINKQQNTDIKLASHAHAVHESSVLQDFSSMVRKISIDRLEEEGKKINKMAASCSLLSSVNELNLTKCLFDRIIKTLLKPNITQQDMKNKFNTEAHFVIPWDDVYELCQMVLDIIKEEDMILHLRAPIKIYGDIHGQFYDLMRLFQLYKSPVEEDLGDILGVIGDIDSTDYLFLGDYVDRGTNSLETICLLFALKCKYPHRLHLLRGNHEDSAINAIYGFQEECKRRLKEDSLKENSCWNKFNEIFEWLPVGALIDDKILCVHGGIGGSIHKVSDIAELQRPLKVTPIPHNEYEQRITDLLWSDPTDNDSILGIVRNDIRDPEGTGKIVKFGPDIVQRFLKNNKLSMIIRAHECVMDGFERFAGGKLLTLFSATNYCNHYQNAGALLFVRRGMSVIPKLIYPSSADSKIFNTWDAGMTEVRPPTPPRSNARIRHESF